MKRLWSKSEIDVIPVYGFNSSGYDINVCRKYLPKVLSKFQKNHGDISKAEKEWILSLNEKLNRTLMENYRIGKYNVDGYDSETKTANLKTSKSQFTICNLSDRARLQLVILVYNLYFPFFTTCKKI